MKKFFYSVIGKTVLIILCTVLTLTGLLSLAGGLVCVSADIYTKAEENLQTRMENDWIYGMVHLYMKDVALDEKNPTVVEENEEAAIGIYARNKKTGYFDNLCAKTSDYDERGDMMWWEGYFVGKDKQYAVGIYDKIGTVEASRNGIALAYRYRYTIWWVFGISVILLILGVVTLMTVAGRKAEDKEPVKGFFGGMPVDVLVALYLGMFAIAWYVAAHSTPYITLGPYGTGEIMFPLVIAGLLGAVIIAATLLLGMNIAIHWKLHNTGKTTLIYRIFGSMAKAIPMVPKTAGFFLIICFLELLGLSLFFDQTGRILMLWFLEKCLLLPLVMYLAIMLKRLNKTAKAMAEGNLEVQVDMEHMQGIFREHAEYLGSIAQGMNIAVQEQVKSERMKTELITNVSHDLKTPLTSIVNYSDLIGKEETENKKIKEYSEILLKQSQKLKRLIEDLVEVSKASTGNLEVALAPCNAVVFLEQAGGEYQERLEKANLELIVNKPDCEIPVMADGRRMWRIFDNLMNNICKYAKEGTRVYLSIEKMENQAVICFKNTSRAQLNISAGELMERFVRGEQSRTTEGNGLGLSIAKSLTELQNGKLTIEIDGDLFKVSLFFPC